MSLLYMKILEKQPEKYDEEFQKLFPESKKIYDLILERTGNEGKVLEIGSGTGNLAIQLAHQGLDVTTVDISEAMIAHAKLNASKEEVNINFIHGDFTSYQTFRELEEIGKFDVIISTFAISEFTPLRQKLFLKQTDHLLKANGILFIAADCFPSSLLKRTIFSIKHSITSQITVLKNISSTYPVKDFEKLLDGYFSYENLFQKGSVKLFQCTPKEVISNVQYKPEPLVVTLGEFKTIKKSWCILNGIFTRKAISPGLYTIGSPDEDSPVLVTCNYYWTINEIVDSLITQKINCYVLVVDSNGINVWCAAGGKHFTQWQIIDALRLFDVEKIINHKKLILPQLSATGVDHKELKKFGWKPEFGPVYINHLKEYLESAAKTKNQSIVDFSLKFRTLMGVQHTFFLLFTLFIPLLIISFLIRALGIHGGIFWFEVMIQSIILGIYISMAFALIYPIFNFTSSFFKKGIIFSGLNIIVIVLYFIITVDKIDFITIIFWGTFSVLLSMIIALDFSGNTPYTNHLDVESDLILFTFPALILCLIILIIPALYPSIGFLFI